MKDKVLTISIAAYNVEKYLKTALDSLLTDAETLGKMEILIVDDGSKDGTAELAQSYANQYPESFFVISKENGGWGSTVNCGIQNAHGKYFRLLDGDDWYVTENLPEYIHYLETIDADIVLSSYKRVYEKNEEEEIMSRHTFACNKVYKLDEKQAEELHMHELTVKTSLLQDNQVMISEKAFYTDNEFVFLPLLYASTIARFGESIYCYRIGAAGQSISLESRRRNWKSGEIVSQRLLTEFKLHQSYLSENVKNMLCSTLENIIDWQYRTLLLMNVSKENKERLLAFDSWLKEEDANLYREIGESQRVVRWLRRSHFSLYAVIHVYLAQHMKRGK